MTQSRHSNIGMQSLNTARGVQRLALYKSSKKISVVILALLGLGTALVLGQRVLAAQALDTSTRAGAVRYVSIVSPKNSATDNLLRLPGTLQGFVEAPLYARTNGYLAAWYKDIGDTVKQGDLLARIDTPEVAQQLQEARSAHDQAVANLKLASSSRERWEVLRKADAVSQQEVDERRNTQALALANEAATAATLKRLQSQLDYNRITAPFAGVITKRNIDVGNLVDAGSGTKLLFVVTRSDPLRVFVQVPQSYSPQIKLGDSVEITLQELPGKVFSGSIVRTARAIDVLTRSLQVEINLANPKGELLPGSYGQVAIKAKTGAGAWRVPGNTLLFRPEGPRVALVDAAGKVHLQPVSIRRELGVEVELASGVKADDRLILNPADSLDEGDLVTVQRGK